MSAIQTIIPLHDVAPYATQELDAWLQRLRWRVVSLAHNAVISDITTDQRQRLDTDHDRIYSTASGIDDQYLLDSVLPERDAPMGLASDDYNPLSIFDFLISIDEIATHTNWHKTVQNYCLSQQRKASAAPSLAERLGLMYDFVPKRRPIPRPIELMHSIEQKLHQSYAMTPEYDYTVEHLDYLRDDYIAYLGTQLLNLSAQAVRSNDVLYALRISQRISAIRERLNTI